MNGRRYSDNPVATAATGVAGGVADLGSIAAYPFYCFPNYGSCSVRVPYRYMMSASNLAIETVQDFVEPDERRSSRPSKDRQPVAAQASTVTPL